MHLAHFPTTPPLSRRIPQLPNLRMRFRTECCPTFQPDRYCPEKSFVRVVHCESMPGDNVRNFETNGWPTTALPATVLSRAVPCFAQGSPRGSWGRGDQEGANAAGVSVLPRSWGPFQAGWGSIWPRVGGKIPLLA